MGNRAVAGFSSWLLLGGKIYIANLIGRPCAVPFVRRHAASVAAIEFANVTKREEVWIRRREHLLIDSDLTGVGISGGAASLAACMLTALASKLSDAF
jgi:hypothetical protein